MAPWTVAHQAPLSMEFSKKEYWSGLPFAPPGDLPDSGIKLRSPALQADSLLSESPGKSNIPNKVSKLGFLSGCQLHADPIELSRHYVQGRDTSGQIRPTLSRKGPAIDLVCIRIPGAGFQMLYTHTHTPSDSRIDPGTAGKQECGLQISLSYSTV